MSYPLEDKLVIAVAASALFDLSESHRIFREQGTEAYREYQRAHQEDILKPGVAFPFIRRLLSLNGPTPEDQPVEVILLSRNDPDTGLRVFKSIEAHKLDITRGAFLRGRAPYRYVKAFNASLFLSANEKDVREAILAGYPAGVVLISIDTITVYGVPSPKDHAARGGAYAKLCRGHAAFRELTGDDGVNCAGMYRAATAC